MDLLVSRKRSVMPPEFGNLKKDVGSAVLQSSHQSIKIVAMLWVFNKDSCRICLISFGPAPHATSCPGKITFSNTSEWSELW